MPYKLNPLTGKFDYYEAGSGSADLATVLANGNTSGPNDIQFDATQGVLLNNGSRLREGTIDALLGGQKGIAQICAVGYELKWEAGRQYIMDGNGIYIRHSLYNFTITPTVNDDVTLGYLPGSRWSLDNGDTYVCTDETTGAAVWIKEVPPGAGSGGGGVFYYFNYGNTTDISPTTGLPTSPVAPSQLGINYSVGSGSITSADLTQGSYDLVCGFVTIVGTPGVTNIPAGLWDFNIWADILGSVGLPNQTQFQIRVYKYDGANAPTLLASSDDVYIYDPVTTAQYIGNVTMPQTTILATDRIYIELWAQKNVSQSRQVRFYFDSLHPSHVHTTLPSVAGTGIVKTVNGVMQSPASLLLNADVDANAGIVVSKLSMATARLLGRTTAGTGAPQEITVGTGLSLSAGNLAAVDPAGWSYIVKSANQDVTNATLTDDTELQFSIVAGGSYMIELTLATAGDSSSNDYRFGFIVSSGTMNGSGNAFSRNGTNAATQTVITSLAATTTNAVTVGQNGGTIPNSSGIIVATANFGFYATANATFKMQFALVSNTGSIARTLKGSILKYKRLD
jgi:hypothetical protein